MPPTDGERRASSNGGSVTGLVSFSRAPDRKYRNRDDPPDSCTPVRYRRPQPSGVASGSSNRLYDRTLSTTQRDGRVEATMVSRQSDPLSRVAGLLKAWASAVKAVG